MNSKTPRKILIIDDEGDLCEMLSIRLETAGYEVRAATNGPTGIDVAKTFHPNVILLDIMMPGMDGWEVCKILRSDDTTKLIPIVFITAAQAKAEKSEAIADGVILKPFDHQELTHILKEFE